MKKSMKLNNHHKFLILLFLLVLAVRIFFIFQTPNFSSDGAYYEFRNAEHIVNTLKPMIYDDLSYGGRFLADSHIFHYFLAIFLFLSPIFLKLIPAILLASMVFVVFGVANLITKDKTAALLSALVSAFVPAFMVKTLNQISVYSVVLPLMFLSMYAILNVKKHLKLFIALSFLLPLVHPSGAIFSLSLLVYLLLMSIESMKVNQITKEASIFAIFISLLMNVIILKKLFLEEGLAAVFQGMPLSISLFQQTTALEIAVGIGILPLIFGVLGFAFGLFREKKQPIYLLGSMILTVFLLLVFGFLDSSLGLMLLGLLLAIISAIAFEKVVKYLNLTKFQHHKKLILVFFILIILLFAVWPSIIVSLNLIDQTISEEEINALEWIDNNTPPTVKILADIEEGHYITFFTHRRNVGDTQLLLAPNTYEDMQHFFTTQSLVNALEITNKYGVDYVYFSENTKEKYGITELIFTRDTECLEKVFENGKVEIYKVLC